MQRQLIVFSSMAGSASELARGLWRGGGNRRWLAPLAVFLCLTGAILVLAAGVEALAPFIYAIF
jgi:hypothetical protein